MKTRIFLIGVPIVALLAAGCTDQSRDEYSAAGHEAAQGIKTDVAVAARATKAAASAADNSLKGDGVDLHKMAKNADLAMVATKVKAELVATQNLDTSRLKVDTVGHTVELKGSVPDAHQKALADEKAKSAAGADYTVKDELAVQP